MTCDLKTPRPAKLAFLTQPAPGVYLLNLRVEGEDFYRLEISKGQLDNLVVDGARIALQSVKLGPESILGALAPFRDDDVHHIATAVAALQGGLG